MKMIKEKPVRYKLKKGVKWDNIKEIFNSFAVGTFNNYFEVEVKNKYRNEKEEFEGIKFDSKAEAEFYKYLLKNYKKEEIILQPEFVLQEKFRDSKGKAQRESKYIADFQIDDIVYDVKGVTNPLFKIKEKTFKLKYPQLELKVVKKAPKWTGKEWIEIDELKIMMRERNKKKKLLQNN